MNHLIIYPNEEKYRLLFESSSDALMLLAPPSWNFTVANLATLRMFGASSVAEFTALNTWGISPERQPDGSLSINKAQEMIAVAMREGLHHFEWEHQRLDGKPFTADVLLNHIEVAREVYLQATVRDFTARKRLEAEREQLIYELKKALAEIKILENFLPICSYCKKIRDEKGHWNQIESYITEHSGTDFTHGICPDCVEKVYVELKSIRSI